MILEILFIQINQLKQPRFYLKKEIYLNKKNKIMIKNKTTFLKHLIKISLEESLNWINFKMLYKILIMINK